MPDSRSDGTLSQAENTASPEDQGAGGELGLGAGGRVVKDPVTTVPDPELTRVAKRRSFTAEYKARILAEADTATDRGQVGALLRREGLYSSLLTEWRKQRDAGALAGLSKPRGRPAVDKRDQQIAALQRRAERAESELQKARKVIEVQGKVSALLEEMLGTDSATKNTER